MGIDISAKLIYGLPYEDIPEIISELDLKFYVTPHVS